MNNAELTALRAGNVPRGVPATAPVYVARAKNALVTDVEGREYVDFAAGIGVMNVGHCHPKVVEAVKAQADLYSHTCFGLVGYESYLRLAEKLNQHAPGDSAKRTFFVNSGAEAVENAVKVARYATGRKSIIAFEDGFHGRTFMTLSLTSQVSPYKIGFGPYASDIYRIPYAYCYRCPYGGCYPACGIECVHWIEDTLFRTTMSPEEVAAIFVEPIQGEGGYVVPPPEFHQELRRIAQKWGILYVADEVQSGMGRTGKMTAMEHFGVEPDIIALAKGIASGLPLGAMVAESRIMDWEAGSHASTFGGNPVSCQAALATIELLQGELMANADIQGRRLMEGLKELQKEFECIGDVRGKGLMVGVELVKDRGTKERAGEWRDGIIGKAFGKGLLLIGCGENTLRLCPALTVSPEEIDLCLSMLAEILKETAG